MPLGPEARRGLSKGVMALRGCAGLRTYPEQWSELAQVHRRRPCRLGPGRGRGTGSCHACAVHVSHASLSCSRLTLLGAWRSFERGRPRPLPCSRLALGTQSLGSYR